MSGQRFTQADIDHYNKHGFVLLKNFLTNDELDNIYTDIDAVIPVGVTPLTRRCQNQLTRRMPLTCQSILDSLLRALHLTR